MEACAVAISVDIRFAPVRCVSLFLRLGVVKAILSFLMRHD